MDFKHLASQIEGEYSLYVYGQLKVEPAELLWYIKRYDEKNKGIYKIDIMNLEAKIEGYLSEARRKNIYSQAIVVRGGIKRLDDNTLNRFYKALSYFLPKEYPKESIEKKVKIREMLLRMASKVEDNKLLKVYIEKEKLDNKENYLLKFFTIKIPVEFLQ